VLHVVAADHVLVLDPHRRARLVEEARHDLGVVRREEDLEGHPQARALVPRGEHDPHPSPPDLALDAVTPRHEVAGPGEGRVAGG
jgi:hypothetical protein